MAHLLQASVFRAYKPMWRKGPAKNREKDSIKIRKENKNLFTEKLSCFTS
jgi:hypothetical protein